MKYNRFQGNVVIQFQKDGQKLNFYCCSLIESGKKKPNLQKCALFVLLSMCM